MLWTKRVEKSHSRPPQLLTNYKAALSLVGDTVGSKWQGTVTMPVKYSELLFWTAVQQTQKQWWARMKSSSLTCLWDCQSVLPPTFPRGYSGRTEFHLWVVSNAKRGLPGIARFLRALSAACCTVTFPSSTCLSSRSISFWTMPLSTIWMQFPSVWDVTSNLWREDYY